MPIKFTKPDVKKHIDKRIKFFRKQAKLHISKREDYRGSLDVRARIDELQNVRVTLFGVKLK